MEHRRKCLTCGHIYCYSDKDLKANTTNAAMGAVSAIGSLASIFGGTIFHTAHLTNQTNRYSDKLVDYTHCPHCHSTNTTILTDSISGSEDVPAAPAGNPPQRAFKQVDINSNATPETLIARALLFLEDREWDSANAYAESCLDIDPHNAGAYIVKLMVDLKVSSQADLLKCKKPFDNNKNYQRALRFADPETAELLRGYLTEVNQRIQNEQLVKQYREACAAMDSAETEAACKAAAGLFDAIHDFKDSAELAAGCLEKAEVCRKDAIYTNGGRKMREAGTCIDDLRSAILEFQKIPGWKNADTLIVSCEQKIEQITAQQEADRLEAEKQAKQNKRIIIGSASIVCAVIAFVIVLNTVIIPNTNYNEALALMDAGKLSEAYRIFSDLGNYKDSEEYAKKIAYAEGCTALESDRIISAIAFGKAGDYQDARERSMELWSEVVEYTTIDCGYEHIAAIKNDGTAVGAGRDDFGQISFSSQWNNLVSISAGSFHTVGLKADGTVLATGENRFGECNVTAWENIVAISAGDGFTIGLKSDGTVIATGDKNRIPSALADWENIIAIDAGYHIAGLKADGTVVSAGWSTTDGECNVETWSGIVKIAVGGWHTVGVTTTGEVIAVGRNSEGQLSVSSWKDIIDIDNGSVNTVGLKSDGTVSTAGVSQLGELSVSEWTDIVAISIDHCTTVGLKNDGTVCVAGDTSLGMDLAENWTDIRLPRRD